VFDAEGAGELKRKVAHREGIGTEQKKQEKEAKPAPQVRKKLFD
jgi:hypothetical protein